MTTTLVATRVQRALLLAALLLTLAASAAQAIPAHASPQLQQATRTLLGVSGERFTINGQPAFLLGVSYFDARFWHESDLDALQQRGYNLIRIWLDWREHSFFDANGRLTSEGRARLLNLVDAADRRGIVVDVAILDTDLSFSRDHTATALQQAAGALADRGNVLYDLVNEFNHPTEPFTVGGVGHLATTLRSADPDAIYGVSSTGDYLVRDPATVSAGNVQAMMASPLSSKVLMPHMPRTADWSLQTGRRVRALREHLQSSGQARPIYLQEEARRGHSGLNPGRDEFLRAARAAREAGAAAWIFHTDAGFALDQRPLMQALDSVERAVLDDLPAAVGRAPTTPPTPAPTQPAAPTQPPAGGTPFAVGARIEAEDARSAGERSPNGNAGTAPDYPNATGLDVNRCYACSNGHNARLHWGEWAGYPLSVPQAGRYVVRLRVVTTSADRTLTLLVDGAPVVLDLPVPPGDSYNAYRELRSPAFSLPAGTRSLQVQAPRGMILDWLRVEPAP
ncbi:MAG: hypothetical protein OHK0015_36090 [Chloroflexi bacterium OHK40]